MKSDNIILTTSQYSYEKCKGENLYIDPKNRQVTTCKLISLLYIKITYLLMSPAENAADKTVMSRQLTFTVSVVSLIFKENKTVYVKLVRSYAK